MRVEIDDDLAQCVRDFADANGLTLKGIVNGAVEEWWGRQVREATERGECPECAETREQGDDLQEDLSCPRCGRYWHLDWVADPPVIERDKDRP